MSQKSFEENVLSKMAWLAEKLAEHDLSESERWDTLAALRFAAGLWENVPMSSKLVKRATANFKKFAEKCGDEATKKRLLNTARIIEERGD